MELHDYCFESHEAWHRDVEEIIEHVNQELMKANG
jgi:hypothetical protein